MFTSAKQCGLVGTGSNTEVSLPSEPNSPAMKVIMVLVAKIPSEQPEEIIRCKVHLGPGLEEQANGNNLYHPLSVSISIHSTEWFFSAGYEQ